MKKFKLISIVFLFITSSFFLIKSKTTFKGAVTAVQAGQKIKGQVERAGEQVVGSAREVVSSTTQEAREFRKESVEQAKEYTRPKKIINRTLSAFGFVGPRGNLDENLVKIQETEKDLESVKKQKEIIDAIEKEIETEMDETSKDQAFIDALKKKREELENKKDSNQDLDATVSLLNKISDISDSDVLTRKERLSSDLLKNETELTTAKEKLAAERESLKGPDIEKLFYTGTTAVGVGLGVGGLGFFAEEQMDNVFNDTDLEIEENEIDLISSDLDSEIMVKDKKLDTVKSDKEEPKKEGEALEGKKIEVTAGVLNVAKDIAFTVNQAEDYLKKAANYIALVLDKARISFLKNTEPVTITKANGEEKTIIGNEYSSASLQNYEKLLDLFEEKKAVYDKVAQKYKKLKDEYGLLTESFEKRELEDNLEKMKEKVKKKKEDYLQAQLDAQYYWVAREKAILEWSLYYPVTQKKLSAWQLTKLAVNRAKEHTENFDGIDLTKIFKFLSILEIPISSLFEKKEAINEKKAEVEESNEKVKDEVKEAFFEKMKNKLKELTQSKITETKEKITDEFQE